MESIFWFYFHLGWEHIVDWAALDHLLFLAVLCAIYTLADWRRVLVLVTAFTVGHCLSLIAAGTDTVRLPANWVEALIPATIMLTAVYNLVVSPFAIRRNSALGYNPTKRTSRKGAKTQSFDARSLTNQVKLFRDRFGLAENIDARRAPLLYAAALCFGLIHGLGFSNTFRAMLFPGEEEALLTQLFGFNLGIEAGQVLLVFILLTVASLLIKQFNFSPKWWNGLLSGSAFLVAAYLFFDRIVNF